MPDPAPVPAHAPHPSDAAVIVELLRLLATDRAAVIDAVADLRDALTELKQARQEEQRKTLERDQTAQLKRLDVVGNVVGSTPVLIAIGAAISAVVQFILQTFQRPT